MERIKESGCRVHRVGTVTTGLSMVGFGVLLLCQTVWGTVNYQLIFALWPVILITLGLELLASILWGEHMVYDKGAICLLFLMTLFAMGMAFLNQFWIV